MHNRDINKKKQNDSLKQYNKTNCEGPEGINPTTNRKNVKTKVSNNKSVEIRWSEHDKSVKFNCEM